MKVPAGFILGAATSAYQIEGAHDEDGKGPSIWDTFTRKPGAIRNGDTGDVACDHVHRLESDLDLMAFYGLDAYRFSISWPRVQPTGRGEVNASGLDFYDRLIDGLLARGIRPVATLYHWDLPQALEDAGGWPARETADRFADYAQICANRFGDRVRDWTTLNEQHVIVFGGYASGIFAPGRREPAEALAAAHHLSLAHGLACQAVRASRPGSAMSIVHNVMATRPETGDARDEAARSDWNVVNNELFLGPQLDGAYPDRLLELTRGSTDWSFIRPGDLENIRQPLDVFGLNYYTRSVLAFREPMPGEVDPFGLEHVETREAASPRTDMGWTVDPAGLTEQLVWLGARLGEVPIWITENGAAYDEPLVGGQVHDARRIAYLKAHLEAALAARERGVTVEAYFAWSLLDNFEWAMGYGPRFGLTHVDYATLERIPKDSGLWYAGVIRDRTTG